MVILQNRIPRYRLDFFSKLQELGKENGIDYRILVYGQKQSFGLSLEMNISYIRCVKIKILGKQLHFYRGIKRHNENALIIGELALNNVSLALSLIFRSNKSVAVWGHGLHKHEKIRSAIKLALIRRACWYFAYTDACKNSINKTLYTGKVTVVKNSTNVLKIRNLLQEKGMFNIVSNSMETIPRQVRLTAAFVGNIRKEKQIDFLISASRRIRKLVPEFQLLIIGDNSHLSNDRSGVPNEDQIKWLGPMEEVEELSSLARRASFLMIPSGIGLVAVDSFALGLPILTCSAFTHGPEFSYLQNNKNCLVSGPDLDDYVNAAVLLLRDDTLLTNLKRGCEISSHDYSIESMAFNFHQGVVNCLRQVNS